MPYVGASLRIFLTIRNADGSLMDLEGHDAIVFGVTKGLNAPTILSKSSTNPLEIEITGEGTATVHLTPADTKKINVGRAFYSVHVVDGTDIDVVIGSNSLDFERAPSL